MYIVVTTVLIGACAVQAQFQFPGLSQFIPSSPPIGASGRVLFPPPTPLSQELPSQPAITSKKSPTLKSLLELNSPPEGFFASPKLADSPLRALGFLDPDKKDTSNRDSRLIGNVQISEVATTKPLSASPTTIKFTLDDVPEFLSPSISDSASSISRESVASPNNSIKNIVEDTDTKLTASSREINQGQHLFILTATESNEDLSTWQPSTPFSNTDERQDHAFPSDFQQSSSNFRPSFALPFLDQPPKDQNLFTVIETRNPGDLSFLRSDTAHYLEKEPEVFPLNPIEVKNESTARAQKVTGTQAETVTEPKLNKNPILSKTPMPIPVFFDDIESAETVTPLEKTLPTRKAFHFEQEFLSLLKKNTPKSQSETDASKFEPNPFWFSQQPVNNDDIWQLKGGKRAPSLDLDSQDSIVSQIKIKNSLGGLFGTSLRGLAPKSQKNEVALKILDDLEESAAGKGITVKSFAQEGLSVEPANTGVTTTVKPLIVHHNFSDPRLKLGSILQNPTIHSRVTSHGPQIVPVGEVGEVPHGEQGTNTSSVPSLSAALKHGVQNLNVTAWVSGCPKLYGKAELHCAIEHDAISNTAMTLLWKKKSFTDGRPREHIMTENDLLVMEDERYSLEHQQGGQYVLTIKDFRPKDCGTYECEAKAADTRAASQLILFTCH